MAAALRLVFGLALASLLISGQAWSANHYITDEHEFTFRMEPSHTSKIIRMLPSGTPLTMIEEGDEWARVRTDDGREGWVVKRFLMRTTPKAQVVEQLRQRYVQLQETSAKAQEQAKAFAQENKELTAGLEAARAELDRVTQEYAALRAESAEVIELKQQYQAATASLEDVSGLVAKLTSENAFFRSAESLTWFLAGAAAVFLPWVLGYLSGRFVGKRKQRISF